MSDVDPNSMALDESLSRSRHESVGLNLKGKNFSILNLPNLAKFKEQLTNDPIKLK
jgi:hypothetical protein